MSVHFDVVFFCFRPVIDGFMSVLYQALFYVELFISKNCRNNKNSKKKWTRSVSLH